jgi:hypothetical protein
MIDVKDNEVKENTNQSEPAEEGAIQATDEVEAMPEDQDASEAGMTEKLANSSESMENVITSTRRASSASRRARS